jgi:uncharacterized C2H2 Zn-finger protein
MRQVQINAWCDLCPADERKPAAGAWALAMNEGERLRERPRMLDVCAEHAAELQRMAGMLREHGADAEAAASAAQTPGEIDRGTCPVCGSTHNNRSALARHLRTSHQTTMGRFPSLASAGKRGALLQCPECGQSCTGGQGLSAHRRAAHGAGREGTE